MTASRRLVDVDCLVATLLVFLACQQHHDAAEDVDEVDEEFDGVPKHIKTH